MTLYIENNYQMKCSNYMVTYDEDSDRNNSDDDESGLLGAGPLFFFITKEDIS